MADFFSPTCFGFCSQEDVSDVYSVIITSFSFIQIMSKQRQGLLSQSQRKLWVFLTGLSPHLSQTASPDLEITGTKAGPGFLDPRAQETPVSTLCSLPSCSKQKVSSDKVWNEERFALLKPLWCLSIDNNGFNLTHSRSGHNPSQKSSFF